MAFGEEYVGLDVSATALEMAQSRSFRRPVRFALLDDWPGQKGGELFDIVVITHVLEHVASPRDLLGRAWDFGRYVFVEVPFELNWLTPRDHRWSSTGHINLFDMRILRHLMQSSGFGVLVEGVTCPGLNAFAPRYTGVGGFLRWAARRALLRLHASLATSLFVCHGYVLAEAIRSDGSSPRP